MFHGDYLKTLDLAAEIHSKLKNQKCPRFTLIEKHKL